MPSIKAPTVLRQQCPDLLLTNNHTTTNAIHRKDFVGILANWTGYKTAVLGAVKSAKLRQSKFDVDYKPAGVPGPANLKNEQIYCGDETGVQGRWEANIGAAVSGVFKACHDHMAYGDYKASAGTLGLQGKVPDLVLLDTTTSELLLSGEVKTPWVPAHSLSEGLRDEDRLRRLLGDQSPASLRTTS